MTVIVSRSGPLSLRKEVKIARDMLDKWGRRRNTALLAGDPAEVKRLTDKLLMQRAAKLVSVWDTLPRFSKPDDPATWVPDDEVREIANELSAVNPPLADPIHVRAMRKVTSGYRTVCAFKLKDSARQLLVKRAIAPLLKTSDMQFGRKGRGRNEAIRYWSAPRFDRTGGVSRKAQGYP